jgi:uncharacterized protein YjbI with pentapeptide repeats/DNA-binding Xre family transcriptional regulator
MSRSLRVRADLVPQVELSVKRNGFLRKKDLAEALDMAESTVRKFRKGKPVDYAIFVEICQKLNLEWQDFADLGEIIDTPDLAESENAIAKPQQTSVESNTGSIEANSFLEHFSKSIDQLKSKELDVRIGAISNLGTLAKYSQPAEHWTIMEYLASFIRTNAPRREEGEEERSQKLPEDIQAALTVIGQRDPEKDPPNQRLNLSNTDIRGANLRDAKLQGINLSAAQLQGADLFQADLQRATLIEANLQEAFLKKANLQEASLHQATLLKADCQFANLQEAFLVKANLQEAVLYGADLQGAYLDRANLQEADLGTSKLQKADLRDTNLQEAYLQRAKLQRADLRGANLQEADLIEADLQGTLLWRANLRGAVLQDANLEGTQLWKANLEGTDFTDATNLTQQQIDQSTRRDSTTILPDYLKEQSSGGNASE